MLGAIAKVNGVLNPSRKAFTRAGCGKVFLQRLLFAFGQHLFSDSYQLAPHEQINQFCFAEFSQHTLSLPLKIQAFCGCSSRNLHDGAE